MHELIAQIEKTVVLDKYNWMAALKNTGLSKEVFSWPRGFDKRLGMQLCVFREIAAGRLLDSHFGLRFVNGIGPNDWVLAAICDVFLPMARDLRRRLEFFWRQPGYGGPAADRTVRLDHNSAPYRDATDVLDNLERALSEVNDYPDPEDKEQRITEISATRRLLGSVHMRI